MTVWLREDALRFSYQLVTGYKAPAPAAPPAPLVHTQESYSQGWRSQFPFLAGWEAEKAFVTNLRMAGIFPQGSQPGKPSGDGRPRCWKRPSREPCWKQRVESWRMSHLLALWTLLDIIQFGRITVGIYVFFKNLLALETKSEASFLGENL